MSCLSQEASTRLAVTLKHPSRSDPIRHPNPILRRELVADFNQSIRHGRNNHDQQPSQLRPTACPSCCSDSANQYKERFVEEEAPSVHTHTSVHVGCCALRLSSLPNCQRIHRGKPNKLQNKAWGAPPPCPPPPSG